MGLRDLFKTERQQPLSKVQRRAAALPTGELVTWAENAIMGLGRCMDSWRNTQEISYLIEAEHDVPVVQALLTELRARAASQLV